MRRRRAAPTVAGHPAASAVGNAVASAALLAVLVGCASGTDSPPAAPGASTTVPTANPSSDAAPSSEASPQPSAPAPTTLHVTVDTGSVVLTTPDGPETVAATSVPDGDTGAVLTLTVPEPTDVVTLTVTGTAGGSAQVEPDRTSAVRYADGTLALGAAAPQSTGADGTQPYTAWAATEPTGTDPSLVLDLASVDPAAFPLVVETHLGTSVVASTSWGEREGGRSIAVTPTDWGRVSGATGVAAAWADLLAADPSVDTPGMEKQLQCHLLGAREKATWNLEPWRPDVSLVEYALARCNPT